MEVEWADSNKTHPVFFGNSNATKQKFDGNNLSFTGTSLMNNTFLNNRAPGGGGKLLMIYI